MITYTTRGGQARRVFDAAILASVRLRRRKRLHLVPAPAICGRCQDAGEVPTWAPDGSDYGEFQGMEPCNCPAAAALSEALDDETIAAAGGEPEGGEDWMAF